MTDPVGSPLGTVASWVRDAALTGALAGPMTLVGAIGAAVLQDQNVSGPILLPTAWALVLGAAIGAAVGAPAAVVTRFAWRLHPVVALVLGPLVGSLGAVGTFQAIDLALGLPMASGTELRWVTSAGALVLGPPWLGYVAVRSRGRAGLAVVVATAGWSAVVGAAVMTVARIVD